MKDKATVIGRAVQKETQYGNHTGYDGMQYQNMVSPHSTLGKPKGDNNRGNKGNQIKENGNG